MNGPLHPTIPHATEQVHPDYNPYNDGKAIHLRATCRCGPCERNRNWPDMIDRDVNKPFFAD